MYKYKKCRLNTANKTISRFTCRDFDVSNSQTLTSLSENCDVERIGESERVYFFHRNTLPRITLPPREKKPKTDEQFSSVTVYCSTYSLLINTQEFHLITG